MDKTAAFPRPAATMAPPGVVGAPQVLLLMCTMGRACPADSGYAGLDHQPVTTGGGVGGPTTDLRDHWWGVVGPGANGLLESSRWQRLARHRRGGDYGHYSTW